MNIIPDKIVELSTIRIFTAADTVEDRAGLVLGLIGVLLFIVITLLVGWGILTGWGALINRFTWIPPSLIVVGIILGIAGFISWTAIFFVGLVMFAIGALCYA